MMMFTAKVDKKRSLLILAAAAAVIALLCIFVHGGSPDAPAEKPVSLSTNDARVRYLAQCGWQVADTPVQTQTVTIPTEISEVMERYNQLQQSQGFQLTDYAGKTATRYVYQVQNFPNATEPVYATMLVYKNHIIGGDVTDTSPDGTVQALVH